MWIKIFIVIVILSYSNADIAVLILARGGSKGVRLKNLQKVGGSSLISRTIYVAKSAGFQDVTVSTDNPLIALESVKGNVTVFRRSFITATDWAPSIWGVLEFLESRPDVNILVLMQATSPFTRHSQLQSALEKLNSRNAFDCVFSVTRSFKLRWRRVGETFYPVNVNVGDRVRRQDWDGEYLETGAFYITRRWLLNLGKFQNNNMMSSITETVKYEDLEATDVISVELVPERKGLILKHCEYYVSSRRHGTTVTRRYNDFVQLYDVMNTKYPYRAICRLPPKRVVVGGGSSRFLLRRRAALQRWLTLVACHPVLAHDHDLRVFLCESNVRLEKPKHDEFVLAGTQEESQNEVSTEDMQAAFISEQEQLRLAHLCLGKLTQIFEKVNESSGAERADLRALGAALSALAAPTALCVAPHALRATAQLACAIGDAEQECEVEEWEDSGSGALVSLARDACGAYVSLCARLSRGLHAERAAAAAAAPHAPQARPLRDRHRYALKAALQEGGVARAYVRRALGELGALCGARADLRAQHAAAWRRLHATLTQP